MSETTMRRFQLAELKTASRTIDRAAIGLYAEITDDFNPIHLDPEFAATTPMRGIIAHGMLSLNLVWQSVRASYGADAVEGAALEVRFIRPVRENDVVTASGRIRDAHAGVYDVVVANQNGEAVISGTLTFPE